MKRFLSLAHLTAIHLPPPMLIEAAAKAGFDGVGLRLIQVTETSPGYPLMQDAASMRATKTALKQTGLVVNDIEFVRIEPDTDVGALLPFLDAGAELGAKEIICAPYDPDLARLADTLARLSETAHERGLGISLEFFPWTVVPNLEAAHRVVQSAGPDVAILVDVLHFDRSSSTLDQLREIPAHRLRMAHLCDAPVLATYSTDELLHTARAARLPPGEGQIDLEGFLGALPADLPLGLEVPMDRFANSKDVDIGLSNVIRTAQKLLNSIPTDVLE